MTSAPWRVAALLGCLASPLTAQEIEPITERYDFGRRTARFDLPNRLDEISGLALTPDGRLFGHNDEVGTIHEIDPLTEEVGKRFYVGTDRVRGDFEGLTIVGERFFLVSSVGLLYEFREVGDRESSPYRVTDLGLGATCEVEGLDYDALDQALYLPCKRTSPSDSELIVIHRVPLDPESNRLAPILIPKAQLRDFDLGRNFSPSAIAVDPVGTLVLVAAAQEKLIEVDRSGRIVGGFRLSRNRHPQPEGLAIGGDGMLYVADEENGRDARITMYARRPSTGGGA